MSSLGTILSSSTIPHIRKACASLLTQELLRPDGVQGLCEAIFSGEELDGDGARIEKLEQIAHTLNSTPATMKKEVRVTLLVFCWQSYNSVPRITSKPFCHACLNCSLQNRGQVIVEQRRSLFSEPLCP